MSGPAKPPIGEVIAGRSRLERRLGRGAMGEVFEATQLGLDRRVAIKRIDPRLSQDPVVVERFRREALAAARLGHPHVTQVSELIAEGEPAIVMELLRGETLAAVLRRGRLPAARATTIAAEVLAALEAAHRAGIVHRDLKPENVFLSRTSDGRLVTKVLDFGIARLTESADAARLTATGVILGSPRYAAPEQLESAKRADARADLYAVGALLYHMLAGRPPHTEHGPALILAVIERAPPPLRGHAPDVPASLAAVVHRGLEKSPGARFASAAEMRAAVLGANADAPAAPTRSIRPFAIAILVTASAIAVALLALAVWVRIWRSERAVGGLLEDPCEHAADCCEDYMSAYSGGLTSCEYLRRGSTAACESYLTQMQETDWPPSRGLPAACRPSP